LLAARTTVELLVADEIPLIAKNAMSGAPGFFYTQILLLAGFGSGWA
jgi:hypothetical protein